MNTVSTIGYEGTDIDAFVATLKGEGVTLLADVRAVPLSRKKGFSKKKLAERLESEGIRYRHFGQLGDPKPGREAARAGRYAEFRRIYAKHLSRDATQSAVRDLVFCLAGDTVCLMCFERDPATCHRTMIASQLQKQGIIVRNIFCDSSPNHANDISRRHLGESATSAQQDLW